MEAGPSGRVLEPCELVRHPQHGRNKRQRELQGLHRVLAEDQVVLVPAHASDLHRTPPLPGLLATRPSKSHEDGMRIVPQHPELALRKDVRIIHWSGYVLTPPTAISA